MDHIVTKIDIIKALMGLGISRAIIVHGFNDGPVVGITTYKQVSRRKISDFMNKAAIGNGCHWDFQYQTEHFFLDRWKKWEYCFIDMDTATETYEEREQQFYVWKPKMDNLYKRETTVVRDFQKTGVVQMLKNPALILGDATGLGKTIQILAAFSYYKTKYPNAKLLMLTDKSAVEQVRREVYKFFDGLKAVTAYELDKEGRFNLYRDFLDNQDILITNYGAIRADLIDPTKFTCSIHYTKKPEQKKLTKLKGRMGVFKILKTGVMRYEADTEEIKKRLKDSKYFREEFKFSDKNKVKHDTHVHILYHEEQLFITMENPATGYKVDYNTSPLPKWIKEEKEKGVPFWMAYDEAEAFQDSGSINYKMGRFLTQQSQRTIPITATISKGELWEAYNIATCCGIKLMSREDFKKNHCVYKENVAAGRLKYGYRKGKFPLYLAGYKNIGEFKSKLDPFYLGRAKKDVASELPAFTYKKYRPYECEGVKQAYTKIYEEAEENGRPPNIGQIRIASVCPQLIDETLPEDYISSPVETFIHACKHSFMNEKLIIYLDYRTPVDLLQKILPDKMPKFYKKILKITGEIDARMDVVDLFRDSKDHNILFINSAGRRALNLQFVEDLWFLIDPFTGGDFAQICGRISRIGTESTRFTIHKPLVPDSVMEDSQVIIQSDLRVMKKIAPNSVDEGLIDEEYDIDVDDSEDFMLSKFTSRKYKYIGKGFVNDSLF